MPLFDYTCHKCDHTFEALVFNGEQVECPECHHHKVERHSPDVSPHVAGEVQGRDNHPVACERVGVAA